MFDDKVNGLLAIHTAASFQLYPFQLVIVLTELCDLVVAKLVDPVIAEELEAAVIFRPQKEWSWSAFEVVVQVAEVCRYWNPSDQPL